MKVIDASDTIAAASTSQEALDSTKGVALLTFQNVDSTADIYINFGDAASNGSGSLLYKPGEGDTWYRPFIPRGPINVFSTSQGAEFTLKVGITNALNN